jgi:hypothetical protein
MIFNSIIGNCIVDKPQIISLYFVWVTGVF